MRTTKRRGHFCWCCERVRANERFSGGGHARHVCKDCQKLGAEELAFRQAVRNIDRMIQWETGRVKRKQRSAFVKFLQHPNERIRRYAESIAGGQGARDAPEAAFASPNAIVWQEEEGRGPPSTTGQGR